MTAPKPIGALRETALHAALKRVIAQEGGQEEQQIGGYWVDVARPDLLLEIQTGNFSAMRAKLERLLPQHPLRLVYPLAEQKWIRRVDGDGRVLARRKSPKRGRVEDVFRQLIYLPDFLLHPNFSLEIIFIEEEEIWVNDGQGSWRRGRWSIADRWLLGIARRQVFRSPDDYLTLLPLELPPVFQRKELAALARVPPSLAGKMIYCLRRMGLLVPDGKLGRAQRYRRVEAQ